MKIFFRTAIVFLLVSISANFMIQNTQIDFGWIDYFTRHGFMLLFFLAVVPRLTLLFSSIPFGGLFWWVGWVIAPRLLVAILATIGYWQTNKLLVIASWLIAWGGESGEKYYIQRRTAKISRRRLK